MKAEEYRMFEQKYIEYAEPYFLKSAKLEGGLRIKFDHSFRVKNRMIEIIDIDHESGYEFDKCLASAIGLYHDIGRYRQLFEYGTFKDSDSVDHGDLGYEVIKQEGVLSELSEIEEQIFLLSVKYHNKKFIPSGLLKDAYPYIKLLRDSDKIDVYPVMLDSFEEKNLFTKKIVHLGLEESEKISEEIFDDVIHERLPDKEAMKTITDFKVLLLGWIFDLNYRGSFIILKDLDLLNRLIQSLPDSSKASVIKGKIYSYLDKALKQ